MKRVLITGINGMDGSHLADFLLTKGYEVFGMERRTSSPNRTNTEHLEGKITFVNGDLTDQNSLVRCLRESDPHEVYNLAAQSFVGESWNTPEQTGDVTGLGALRMLEAIREYGKEVKFYQASTSELYGRMIENPASETTPFYPRSPYGVAKLYGHWITKNYRESYDMFNVSGILFNHESERRGIEFVTRKITNGVAQICRNKTDHITLGNLDAKRDWGYSPDYVKSMWMMLQQDEPDDYVIATGETHSVKEFLECVFDHAGLGNPDKYVEIDERLFRPQEVPYLLGDSSKAQEKLGWKPEVTFEELAKMMYNEDLASLQRSTRGIVMDKMRTPEIDMYGGKKQ